MRPLIAALLSFAVAALSAGPKPQVKLTTSMGVIVMELEPQAAPRTVENFLKYVKKGQYNGTIFHRVIPGFMIQCGGFEPGMKQKSSDAPIENEANNGLKNNHYTVAMARTSDPHSATAQFFINVADNAFLNHTAPSAQGWGYAVFGKVIKGQDVALKISKVRTGFNDVPQQTVIIEDVKLLP